MRSGRRQSCGRFPLPLPTRCRASGKGKAAEPNRAVFGLGVVSSTGIEDCEGNCRPQPRSHDRAGVLAAIKERPGSGEQASPVACRPSLTAAARVSRECPAVGTEVSLRRGRTKVRPRKGRRLCRRECGHHQPARLARVSKLASETHEIPRRTPPCALAGSIILSTAGSVLMSGDSTRHGECILLPLWHDPRWSRAADDHLPCRGQGHGIPATRAVGHDCRCSGSGGDIGSEPGNEGYEVRVRGADRVAPLTVMRRHAAVWPKSAVCATGARHFRRASASWRPRP